MVVDGRSTDRTREIAEQLCRKYSWLRLLDNPRKTVPYALNLAIGQARGEWIVRLDAHSWFPPDYFSKLIRWGTELQADNVGGVCITRVKKPTPAARAITHVLSSPFGIGNSLFRTGTARPTATDTVPFGCFRKTVFDRFGLFNERLTRNQDIEMNRRIKAKGGKIYLVPEIRCHYFAREDLKGLASNNFRNGYWNILTVYITRNLRSLSLRHFIPALFILSLVIPLLLMPLWPWSWMVSAAVFLSYQIFIFAAMLSLKNRDCPLSWLWLAFMTLHYSYGAGSLTGLFRIDELLR